MTSEPWTWNFIRTFSYRFTIASTLSVQRHGRKKRQVSSRECFSCSCWKDDVKRCDLGNPRLSGMSAHSGELTSVALTCRGKQDVGRLSAIRWVLCPKGCGHLILGFCRQTYKMALHTYRNWIPVARNKPFLSSSHSYLPSFAVSFTFIFIEAFFHVP